MTRVFVCLSAAMLVALVAATSLQSAETRAPRFLVAITGTQHFEWTIEDSTSGSCSYKGQGEQSETFGTARPVKVIAPIKTGRLGENEFRAFSRGGWQRTVPLVGRETRTYRVLRAPSGECRQVRPEFRRDCGGTNPLLPRAGVVIMRNRQTVALHVPVDTPWIARRPPQCDLRLFDLRDSYLAAVFGLRIYKPVRGGTFENRRAKTLRAAISVRYCVDPEDSDDFTAALETNCEPPRARGPVLTGHLTASWTITFKRTR
jgi:hypothetical protein